MSLIGSPLRFIDQVLGRCEPSVQPDDPIARMIARTAGRLRPEHEYRWRLRGRVVNQYVAEREGLVKHAPRRPEMGRVGRAALYASLGLAISVSAVGAASSGALPGDPLYGLKRQVEELRMEISPPSVRPMLAAMAVEERLSEVELLAAAGSWTRVALAEHELDGAVATMHGMGASLPADEIAHLARHTQILAELLANAPASARAGLERALVASAGAGAGANQGSRVGQENQLGGGTGATSSQANNGKSAKDKPSGEGSAVTPSKQNPATAPSTQPTEPPSTPAPRPTAPPTTAPPTPDPSSDPGAKLPSHAH